MECIISSLESAVYCHTPAASFFHLFLCTMHHQALNQYTTALKCILLLTLLSMFSSAQKNVLLLYFTVPVSFRLLHLLPSLLYASPCIYNALLSFKSIYNSIKMYHINFVINVFISRPKKFSRVHGKKILARDENHLIKTNWKYNVILSIGFIWCKYIYFFYLLIVFWFPIVFWYVLCNMN